MSLFQGSDGFLMHLSWNEGKAEQEGWEGGRILYHLSKANWSHRKLAWGVEFPILPLSHRILGWVILLQGGSQWFYFEWSFCFAKCLCISRVFVFLLSIFPWIGTRREPERDLERHWPLLFHDPATVVMFCRDSGCRIQTMDLGERRCLSTCSLVAKCQFRVGLQPWWLIPLVLVQTDLDMHLWPQWIILQCFLGEMKALATALHKANWPMNQTNPPQHSGFGLWLPDSFKLQWPF